MGKKLWLVVLIFLLTFVGGGIVYWRMARRGAGPTDDFSKLAAREPTPPTPTSATGGFPNKEAIPPPVSVFSPRAGETLEYTVNLAALNSAVATIKLAVRERRNFAGKSSWHFQAFANTENPYRMVFELNDQFDSYSEAANLTGLQYEMHLSERGQKVNFVLRLLSSSHDPAPADATAARVPLGTRDPLGMLHYLRGVDWAKTPEVRCPVYDGRKLYDVRAVLVKKGGLVSVPLGNFTTKKIEIHVFDNGVEMKDAHFLLYLANDPAHTPVLMEAVLPFATARVEMTKAK